MDPALRRLDWTRRLQGIAQNGLTFARDPFDIQRYQAIRQLAAEMLAAGTADGRLEIPALLDHFGAQTGYATPKIDVRGVIFHEDGRILLVRERSDGRWTLPGGWADPGESPSESVVKEIREEAGYIARAIKLLALYDRDRHPHPPMLQSVYKLFFRCEIEGEPSAADELETDAVDFFAPDALPELSDGRVTASQLHRMFEHRLHPDWPTDFD
jgi:ADP-ribose pyrophosphatase YjhB (NUDIX family)